MSARRENFLKILPDVLKAAGRQKLILLLDFDGTLTPIVSRPQDTRLSPAVRKLLVKLSGLKDVRIAIVSGRSLKDVRRKTGVAGLTYAGNHGHEIRGPGVEFFVPGLVKSRPIIRALHHRIRVRLRNIHGVVQEDKGATLSVHYRLVAPVQARNVLKILREITAPLARAGSVRVSRGKKVFEVAPPGRWNKGEAVWWLLRKWKFKRGTILCFGDDKTDEHMFMKLKEDPGAYCVKVGRGLTHAGYRLNDEGDVIRVLEKILEARKG